MTKKAVKSEIILARVEPEVDEKLRRVSEMQEVSKSEIIRESLVLYLDWCLRNKKEDDDV